MFRKLFCAIVALALLNGCCTAEDVTALAFWTDSSERAEEMRSAAALWNEAHPDQALSISATVFQSDIIDDKMWTALHSGVLMPGMQQPDIADIDYAHFSRYVNPQIWLLCPLNRWIGAQPGTAYAAFTYGGICMGIPTGSGEMSAIYNAKALESAGIDAESIRTWEDFLAAGRLYHRETGCAFLAVDMDSYLVFLTLYQQLAAEDGAETGLYSRTLAFLTSLFDANIACIMPGGRSDSRSFREAFASGTAACTFLRRGEAGGLDGQVCPLPAMNGEEGVWIPGRALCVTTFCENIDLAAAFIEFAAGTVKEPAPGVLFPGNTEKTLGFIEGYKLDLAKMILQ